MDVIYLNKKLHGLESIEPSLVNERGIFFDPENGDRFRLSDVQLLALRDLCDNQDIAKDRMASQSAKAEYREMLREAREKRRKFSLQREKKRKRVKFIKKIVNVASRRKVKVAGLVIACEAAFLAGFVPTLIHRVDAPTLKEQPDTYVASDLDVTELPEINQDLIGMATGNVFNDVNNAAPGTLDSDYVSLADKAKEQEVTDEDDKEEVEYVEIVDEVTQKRQELVSYYCSVYGLNYDIVYNKLVELTNNFTSDEWNNGVIPGVSCKGVDVKSSFEELLFMTAIRHMSQIPSDFGLKSKELRKDPVPYDDNKTYEECIAYYGNVVGEGNTNLRDIAYGIFIAETGGDSNLLVTSNNYGGLVGDSGFASYENKDIGGIEFVTTIRYTYFENGMNTPSKMQETYAPSYENDGAWWISTVNQVSGYAEEVLSKYDEKNETKVNIR